MFLLISNVFSFRRRGKRQKEQPFFLTEKEKAQLRDRPHREVELQGSQGFSSLNLVSLK